MRNTEFTEADADGILNALFKKLASNPPQSAPATPAAEAAPRQMSIVEVTEALLKQIGDSKRG